MIVDFLIVWAACGLAYLWGRKDGRDSEEKNWINSYNTCGLQVVRHVERGRRAPRKA